MTAWVTTEPPAVRRSRNGGTCSNHLGHAVGGLDMTARWRYIGPSNRPREFGSAAGANLSSYRLAHRRLFYIDFSASIPIPSLAISFRLGVNNIADKAPPMVANGNYSDCPNTSCNDNTWVGTYDTLGRYLYAHVRRSSNRSLKTRGHRN